MDKTYKIKRLEWKDNAIGSTSGAFGIEYSVSKDIITSDYMYRIYGHSGRARLDITKPCRSCKHGQFSCQSHFNKFIEQGLEEI